jgi:type III secretory pathway component EscS
MDTTLYAVLLAFFRSLSLLAIPPLIGLTLVGIAVSVLESLFSLHEVGMQYMIRLLAFIALAGILGGYWWRTLIDFTRLSFE